MNEREQVQQFECGAGIDDGRVVLDATGARRTRPRRTPGAVACRRPAPGCRSASSGSASSGSTAAHRAVFGAEGDRRCGTRRAWRCRGRCRGPQQGTVVLPGWPTTPVRACGARAARPSIPSSAPLAQRVIDLLDQRDPALLSGLVEVGIVSRDFRDQGEGPVLTNTPTIDVVERLLERSVEQRPSLLSRLGLSTIQALATSTEEATTEGGVAAAVAVVFTDLEGFTRVHRAGGRRGGQRAADPAPPNGRPDRSEPGRPRRSSAWATGYYSRSLSPRRPRCVASSWSRLSAVAACACAPGSTWARSSSPATTSSVTS